MLRTRIIVVLLAFIIILPACGRKALMIAACKGDTVTVQDILDKGMDVNVKRYDGRTALMHATVGGHIATVQALLDRGADVNVKNDDGDTALMLAERGHHTEIVELLKQAVAKE